MNHDDTDAAFNQRLHLRRALFGLQKCLLSSTVRVEDDRTRTVEKGFVFGPTIQNDLGRNSLGLLEEKFQAFASGDVIMMPKIITLAVSPAIKTIWWSWMKPTDPRPRGTFGRQQGCHARAKKEKERCICERC